MHELPDEGFTGWHLAVRLDPHGAAGFPATFGGPALNAAKEFGSILLEKCVLLSLAGNEAIVRVALHELERRRPAAHDLAPSLGERP
jgi:hypothetical protein